MERKLRDSWAKWHNIILKWDELTLDLFHRLQKFLSTRTQLDYYTAPSLHALQSTDLFSHYTRDKVAWICSCYLNKLFS